jgi:pimeloyl-ACP methyl ester carboxylesterase
MREPRLARTGVDMSHFIERDGVRIHYLRHDGPAPPMVLIHGLTANARCFDSIVRMGLTETRGALAVDLRGRGLSDKPPRGYSVAEHAADVIALLDHHGIDRTVICGHSYGGLVTLYLASEYPDRVERAIVIDIAGPSIRNQQVFELIKPSLDRLGRVFPSRDAYLSAMRAMPSLDGHWGPEIEGFYDADIEDQADGTVRVRIPAEVIQQVILEGQKVDWQERMGRVRQPVLLLHALGGYGPPGTPSLVLEEQAREAVALLPDCRYARVPGNHMTMLLGENAREMLTHMRAFVAGE